MKKAFTIVELLVVMAVIGILITLAVVGIQAIQKSQRETVRVNDLRNISSTLETYFSKYRAYPVSNAALGTAVGSGNCASSGGISYTAPTLSFCPAGSVTVGTLYTVTLQALGGLVYTGTGADQAGMLCGAAVNDATHLQGTADVWTIFYKTAPAAASPQSYTLYGCTENGFSTKFGSY